MVKLRRRKKSIAELTSEVEFLETKKDKERKREQLEERVRKAKGPSKARRIGGALLKGTRGTAAVFSEPAESRERRAKAIRKATKREFDRPTEPFDGMFDPGFENILGEPRKKKKKRGSFDFLEF